MTSSFFQSKLKSIHALILLFLIFVVGLGAYTRLTQSGLGCPDWPACYGHWQVHANITSPYLDNENISKAWIEMFHRYCAGTLAFLVASFAIVESLHHKKGILHALPIIILLTFQALLGKWTVTWKLHPLVVSSHLCGGMLLGYWFVLRHQPPSTASKHMAFFQATNINRSLYIFKTLLWGQIFLGGWTSSQYASLACPNFPHCYARWSANWHTFKQAFFSYLPSDINYEFGLLPLNARGLIHMCHRTLALLLIFNVLLVLQQILSHKIQQQKKQMLITFAPLLVLFLLQLALGIANVILQLPIFVATAHNVIALLLLIKCAMVSLKTMPASKPYTNEAITAQPKALWG